MSDSQFFTNYMTMPTVPRNFLTEDDTVPSGRKEIVVVDTAVQDFQTLVAGLDPDAQLVLIQEGENGMAVLADALEGQTQVDALHIVSHGDAGRVSLGDDLLTIDSLGRFANELQIIQGALDSGADLLLYGCRVGGSGGQLFVEALALATGADVAASDDLTGHASLKGDWELEIQTGSVESDSPFSDKALMDFSHVLAYTGRVDFSNVNNAGELEGASGVNASFYVGSYLLVADGLDASTYAASGRVLSSSSESFVTFYFSGGETFDVSSLYIFNDSATQETFSIISDKSGDAYTSGTVNPYAGITASLTGFDGITRLYVTSQDGSFTIECDNMELAGVQTANSAPTLTGAPPAVTVVEDTQSNIDLSSVSLADSDGDTLTLTLTAGAGTFSAPVDAAGVTETLVDSATITLEGPAANLNTYLDTASNIKYTAAANASGTAVTTITLSASDGSASLSFNPVVNVNITAVNDAPVLDLDGNDSSGAGGGGYASIFQAGGPAVNIADTDTLVSDVDDASMETAVITLAGTRDGAGEGIRISGTPATMGGVAIAYTSATQINLSGTASLADYQAVIEAIEYTNSSTATAGDRTVSVTVNDGASDSNTATSTITVLAMPRISAATYDAGTGDLVVTGSDIQASSGADIDASLFTFTGEGGQTHTLTTTSDVERTSATQFTLTLSAADKAAVNQIMNRNGTESSGSTVYDLGAGDDWNTNVTAGDSSDATGNGITVSNVPAPTITSATYDAATGVLAVTGTGFVQNGGAANDIDVSRLTLIGEGGASHILTGSDVEITSGTAFSITLTSGDKAAVNQIANKNGSSATDGTLYTLAAAEDWAAGADAAVNVVDTTGNGITVSNVPAPTITSAAYDAATGVLGVTGTGFVQNGGAANDIDVSRLTLTGEGGASHILTGSDVEITSGTAFSITLTSSDKAAVNQIVNKNGSSATDGTLYTLAAAEDWAAGADAAVNVVDTTGNGITVSNVPAPTLTSADYDYTTNVLTVTGTGFVSNSGAANDIDISKFTFTGEAGGTYTLTSTADVDITSGTSFSVTLSGVDIYNVEGLLNKDGASSDDGTLYTLAAGEDWAAGADTAVNVADTTANGMTVSNYSVPAITSAAYDWSTGQLVLTGTNFVARSGAANDMDASLLTVTGQGGATYTLADTSDAEISSATSATLTLSAHDALNVRGLLNKNGSAAGDATTYTLAAADNWMAGAPAAIDTADAATGIAVSNVVTPTLTSAVYDAITITLDITGTHLFKTPGAGNDVDVSQITLTGGNNQTYTLATSADVEISSATSFSIDVTGTDQTQLSIIFDQLGTSSSYGISYNLAAADNWLAGADTAQDISDAANSVIVSIPPTVTSATYDAVTGTLVITGSNIQANVDGADIDASAFTLTGEGGQTYTLTNTADVERDSISQFTLVLGAADKAAVNQITNKNGTSATDNTTYTLAAADDWNTNVTSGDTSDTTGNIVTASNVIAPAITSAAYDAATGVLVVTGTNFVNRAGTANDIDVSLLTIAGEGGATHALASADVDITSGTTFSVTLTGADQAAVHQILNRNGTSATGGNDYFLAAAEDWAVGADAAVIVADLSGNGIMVSNVAVPAITSATYDTGTGYLVVTGTGFTSRSGAANDIDISAFTLTGQGGTHTLTAATDVEITSGTQFAITLSGADKTAVNALMDKDGIQSSGGTTYNLAAAEDWAAGADAAVTVADLTGNTILVSVYVPPPSTGGGGSSTTTVTATVDGAVVTTTTNTATGTQSTTITPVSDTRTDSDDTTGNADVPLVQDSSGNSIISVALAAGTGVNATGLQGDQDDASVNTFLNDAIISLVADTDEQAALADIIDAFTASLGSARASVRTITPTLADPSVPPEAPILITGSLRSAAQGQEAVIIDAGSLPSGTRLQLDNIDFAIILGPVEVSGGSGPNIVYGDNYSQTIVLGPDDDDLHGGGGNDTVGSEGGDDRIFGDDGDDTLFGGDGNDILHGGQDRDTAVYSGNQAEYEITVDNGKVHVRSLDNDGDTDTLINIESIQFADTIQTVTYQPVHTAIATLYRQIFDSQADLEGFQYWAGDYDNGQSIGDIGISFLNIHTSINTGTNFDSLNTAEKIEKFYQVFLNREADGPGLEYWLNDIENGISLSNLAELFIDHFAQIQGVQIAPEQWDFII